MLFSKLNFLLILYAICIYGFAIFIRYLEYAEFFLCFNCEEVDSPDTLFDYIIVGCGSAGAVVARRLSEDQNIKVLVLEAGKYGNDILDIPAFGALLHQSLFDWRYTTVPQSNSCLSLKNKKSIWPMGKMVGGTGMLNNMIHVRGHPDDFNYWFKDKEGYSYQEHILPYFKKLEQWEHEASINFSFQTSTFPCNCSHYWLTVLGRRRMQVPLRIQSTTDMNQSMLHAFICILKKIFLIPLGKMHGSVYISNLTFSTSLSTSILEGARELGYVITEHPENCEEGFGLPKVNLRNGQRWTSAHSLLQNPRPNIFLRTNRIVEKVLLHHNFEAYGVKYSYLGQKYIAKATKGVILSAGVVGTPKILLHSGIGPKSHLDEVGIQTKIDLPVGENLQDHLTTGFDLILLNQSIGIGIAQILSPFSAYNYFSDGSGPWTTGGCEVLAYLNTKHNKNNVPDLQFMVMNLGLNADRGIHFRHLIGITDDAWFQYFEKLEDTVTATILPVLLHPKSRGTVRLKDKEFSSAVLIDPNYLSHKDDIEVLVSGIAIIRKLLDTKAMKSLGASFNTIPFPPCQSNSFGSKAYWRCYVRHLTSTSYHPAGTCKMGHNNDSSSVTNFNFEVKGTNNLFVVDASVIPNLTSGNVNAAVLMLAEMASDILKNRRFLNEEKCPLTGYLSRKYPV